MRPRVYGPRSLILTTTERPLSRSVTFAHEASGSERCAAVAVTVSRISPLAVCLPTKLYQAAFPNRVVPVVRHTRHESGIASCPSATGSKPANGGSARSNVAIGELIVVIGPSAEQADSPVDVSPFPCGWPVA